MTTLSESESALIDGVFELAHAGPDAESPERKSALWTIGITLLADVLLSKPDELEREMLLNGLWRELRAAVADIVHPHNRVLGQLQEWGWNPIFVGMHPRITYHGFCQTASLYEIQLDADRAPVPDDHPTVQGEIAKPKKSPDETARMLKHLGIKG